MGKIGNIVNYAKELGMPAVGLTDHGVMHGAVEFYKTAKKAGIKSVIGCEIYISARGMLDKEGAIDKKSFHLTVLAKDNIGYKNLIAITSTGHTKGYYYKPRVDKAFLKEHSEGLICLTGCPAGEIPRAVFANDENKVHALIKEYFDIFGKENVYFEIQDHPNIEETMKLKEVLPKLAKQYGRPVVATNDVHYVRPDDAAAQDVLVCISTGKLLSDTNRMTYIGNDFSMRTAEEMVKSFAATPEAIDTTLAIAERCNVELSLGNSILPAFKVPEGETEQSYFEKLCLKGFKERYGDAAPEEHKERLKYELGVINQMGYPAYFLIVQDFVRWAKNQDIAVGPGRGSAAGSIAAYCLHITELDPMAHRLLFERFLNPERVSMPDIDMDFEDARRGEVIGYVTEKYGADHVSQICTFGTMAAKNAVRDVGRVLGIPYGEVDRISKLIPEKLNLKEAKEAEAELGSLIKNDPRIAKLYDFAERLEGNARHTGMHAAGIVISREPLTEYLPVMTANKGEAELLTQYPMGDIEEIGLLKMDFLGLANLSIIRNCVRLVKETQGKDIDIANLKMDDKETYKLLARAESIGIFQLESAGMRRYLAELKPSKFGDIVAMVALYRPGPLERIPTYVARKHGREAVSYLHEDLKPILEDTYGVLVYQEQVQEMAQQFAGFTLGQGYLLVKAVAKKKAELLEEQKKKFIEGAAKMGREPSLAERLFAFIEPFARYGFNRAHSACYAYIAYQTAYLKAHFPAEFMAAWLISEEQNIEKMAIALEECERMKLPLLPPDINRSKVDFTVLREGENESILFGLSAIKNVGVAPAEAIVMEREKNGPYASFSDFLKRLGSAHLNKKVLEALAQAGALDAYGERNQLFLGTEAMVKFLHDSSKQAQAGLTSLFGEETKIAEAPLELPKVEPVDATTKLGWEKELLGMYLSEHPLTGVLSRLKDKVIGLGTVTAKLNGRRVRVAGVVSSVKKIITKSNQPMVFAKLEDASGNIEAVVFPSVLETTSTLWENDRILLVEGKLNDKDGSMKILADKVTAYTEDLDPASLGEVSQEEPRRGGGRGNGAWTPNFRHSEPLARQGQGSPRSESPAGAPESRAATPTSSTNRHPEGLPGGSHEGSRPSTQTPAEIPRPSGARNDEVRMLTLKLNGNTNQSLLQELKEVISSHTGAVPITLAIAAADTERQYRLKQGVDASSPLLRRQLERLLGPGAVELA